MLDSLEPRRLLSDSYSNGVLTVTGTDHDDTITLTVVRHHVVVNLNGATSQFDNVTKVNVNGLNGNDRIDALALTVPTFLRGWNGNDVIFGGSGGDRLLGDAGTDQLYGNDGGDQLDGGNGSFDLLSGGNGSDSVDYSRRTQSLTLSIKRGNYDDGEPGENDNIRSDVEAIASGSGDDTITGWKFDDVLLGGAGDDSISGDDGRDTINGDTGDDSIHGNNGSDIIRGGDGDDELDGDDGDHNTLYGGDGDDELNTRNESTDDAMDGGHGHDEGKFDFRIDDFGHSTDADNRESIEHEEARPI